MTHARDEKQIVTANGHTIIVDDSDFDRVSAKSWWGTVRRGKVTNVHTNVRKNGKQTTMQIGPFLIGEKSGFVVDHINRNPLDNRRSNLRHVTQNQNMMNMAPYRLKHERSSKYKGVSRAKKDKSWRAFISAYGKNEYLGSFSTPEAAAEAYNKRSKELHGDCGYLNQIAYEKEIGDV